jgi:ACS family hexuronate transporter-like MFS transporter
VAGEAAAGIRKIAHLRWWITGLLFLSTVINYVDRQTLSVLARTIQDDLRMSDIEYSYVVQAFLLAYAVSYLLSGRFTDWLGTRASMACFIVWWSAANMLTGLSRSVWSLGVCRFLLGIGEPGNYTAAPKALSEWFTPKDRGLAYGIYTAGATIGATLAPPLIATLATSYGWRAAFVMTGALGLLWVVPWLWLYHRPARHPRITAEELAMVPADELPAEGTRKDPRSEWRRWRQLLSRKETWLILFIRLLTDPVWYFYLFWFPKYLQDARHLSLKEVGKVAWVVYFAADLGSVLGGWLSGALIRRGTSPVASRKRVMAMAACLLPLSPLVAFAPSANMAILIASIIALAHLAFQATGGALVVDLYPSKSIATAFGIIAAGSGLGGMLATNVVGQLVTAYSYTPVFALMGLLHPLALLLLWRVREGRDQARSL